eukprot:scaffold45056_cov21-Phaeocystis_antarctica.AAC.1
MERSSAGARSIGSSGDGCADGGTARARGVAKVVRTAAMGANGAGCGGCEGAAAGANGARLHS